MPITSDVLIAGGGPGGCAAAIYLARAGLVVTLVEREVFPRFRLGESLLPMVNGILRELGLWEKMEDAGFIRKYGAEFLDAAGEIRVHNVFARGLIPGLEFTYQVERSRFDEMLLENAREAGVRVLQPDRVQAARETADGWEFQLGGEVAKSAYFIDATGRDAFSARAMAVERDPLPYPKRIAVFNHFTGVRREPGKRGGNILIVRLRDGWFWVIPISADRTSVGAVIPLSEKPGMRDPEGHFRQLLAGSPALRKIMDGAAPVAEWRATADYTYSYRDYAGPRMLRVGDAAGFIDPIFSSGVYLSMSAARLAAGKLIAAANDHRPLRMAEQKAFTRTVKKEVGVFRKLIDTFYDEAGFAIFMNPKETLGLAAAVNSVVAGNTRLGFSVWWRFQIFLLLCSLNKRFPIVPRIALPSSPDDLSQ